MIDASRITALFNKNFCPAVVEQIDGAFFSIDICIYDWRTYPSSYGPTVTRFNDAIKRAVDRGVEVRVVLNSVREAARLHLLGCRVFMFTDSRTLHTKLMIIDRSTVIVGSHNYSESAFSTNEEVSIMLQYDTEATDFTTYFERLVARFSK